MRIRYIPGFMALAVTAALGLSGCTPTHATAGARHCWVANIGFDNATSVVDGQTVRGTLADLRLSGFTGRDVADVHLKVYDTTMARAINGKRGTRVLLPVGHTVRITETFALKEGGSVRCEPLTVRIPTRLPSSSPSAQSA